MWAIESWPNAKAPEAEAALSIGRPNSEARLWVLRLSILIETRLMKSCCPTPSFFPAENEPATEQSVPDTIIQRDSFYETA
jgi:hypothetical protein